MYKITNLLNGQIVCSLSDNSTLRICGGESIRIKEELVNSYLKTIEKKGYVQLIKISEKPVNKVSDKSVPVKK